MRLEHLLSGVLLEVVSFLPWFGFILFNLALSCFSPLAQLVRAPH